MNNELHIHPSSERGTTLLEFTIVIVFMLGIVGGIIDTSIGLRNWSTLTYGVQSYSRTAALNDAFEESQGTPECGDIERALETRATDFFRSSFGSSSAAFNVSLQEAAPSLWTVSVQGNWPQLCFFCGLLSDQLSLSSSTTESIQATDFNCITT